MTLFNPTDAHALRERLQHYPDSVVVACYCAAWCDTCRAYQPDFETLATRWPDHTFIWIDIEDHPGLLGDDDVDDFPTILIQTGNGNAFFGEQLPHITHLDRLIQSVQGRQHAVVAGPPSLRDALSV